MHRPRPQSPLQSEIRNLLRSKLAWHSKFLEPGSSWPRNYFSPLRSLRKARAADTTKRNCRKDQISACFHLEGCYYGGGGGNLSKVKRLIPKWIGTQKRLFAVLCNFCTLQKLGYPECRKVITYLRRPRIPLWHLTIDLIFPQNKVGVCNFNFVERTFERQRDKTFLQI